MNEYLIEIKNLHKYFGKNEVLKGLDIQIKKGEVVVMIGPSGSGKSTFLRTMNLLEKPTDGQVYFEGVNIADKSVDVFKHREKMGMVFQQFNLFPNMTVLENLCLAPVKTGKMTKEEAKKTAEDLLQRVGLSDKAEAYPQALSGGQQQRVAIARALAMNPDVMLFDEPTSALDPELVKEVLDIIRKLKKQKITMLIVSHEMNFVREISDRIVVMEKGEILEIGTSQQIFENPFSERVREFLNTTN